MDYEAIKTGLPAAIPFVQLLKLEYVDVGPGTATVRLPDRPQLSNHVGSQHAGALFTAAEAASGGAFVSAFSEHMPEITALAKSARISYERLARGPIDATGTLEDAGALLATLDSDGRVEFPIEVVMRDQDGQQVASATVDWHVRRKS